MKMYYIKTAGAINCHISKISPVHFHTILRHLIHFTELLLSPFSQIFSFPIMLLIQLLLIAVFFSLFLTTFSFPIMLLILVIISQHILTFCHTPYQLLIFFSLFLTIFYFTSLSCCLFSY